MWNNHHTKFHRNMNKESGVIREGPLFSWGGGGVIMISRRKESLPPSIQHLQVFFLHSGCADNFFKIPQILHNILGGLCRQFFSRCTSGADNFFQFFSCSCRQFFSQSRYPRGKIMVPPLCWQIPPPSQVRWGTATILESD